MKRFTLIRHSDMTGVSGTGVVAWGVEFNDGQVVLQWKPGEGAEKGSVSVWSTMSDMCAVHLHHDLTKVEYWDHA